MISNNLVKIYVLFNLKEAEAFSEVYCLGTKDIKEIALKIANQSKHNIEKKRVVVITQGEQPVIVARGLYFIYFKT